MTALDQATLSAIIGAVADHARASGKFDRVNGHESTDAPGNGVTGAVWVQRLAPNPMTSGLSSTSVLLVLTVRCYTPAFTEPMDMIDPNLLDAAQWLMAEYSGDFELGGTIDGWVDLLGQSGSGGVAADAGYQNISGKIYRVMSISLPMVINDVWTQAP